MHACRAQDSVEHASGRLVPRKRRAAPLKLVSAQVDLHDRLAAGELLVRLVLEHVRVEEPEEVAHLRRLRRVVPGRREQQHAERAREDVVHAVQRRLDEPDGRRDVEVVAPLLEVRRARREAEGLCGAQRRWRCRRPPRRHVGGIQGVPQEALFGMFSLHEDGDRSRFERRVASCKLERRRLVFAAVLFEPVWRALICDPHTPNGVLAEKDYLILGR